MIGAVARAEHAHLKVIPAAKQTHLTGFIKDVTTPDATVYTEDVPSYKELDK